MPRNDNLNRIETQVTPEEFKLIKKTAEKKGMSISEYTRFALMWSLIEDGNMNAVKNEALKFRDYIGKKLRKRLINEELIEV